MKIQIMGTATISHGNMTIVSATGENPQVYNLPGTATVRLASTLSEKGLTLSERTLAFNGNTIAIWIEDDPLFGEVRVMPLNQDLYQRMMNAWKNDPEVAAMWKKVAKKAEDIDKDLISNGPIKELLFDLFNTNWTGVAFEALGVFQKHFPDQWNKIYEGLEPEARKQIDQIEVLRALIS